MRIFIKNISIALLLIFVASCASTKYLYIEVLEPAGVKFSKNIVNVTIVDNAGVVLSDSIEDIENSEEEKLTSYGKEKLKEALLEFMNEEEFFYDVSLYPTAMRTDIRYGMLLPLGKKDIQNIAAEMDADAVISIDGFETTVQKVLHIYEETVFNATDAKNTLLFNVYDAQGNAIAPPMLGEDSLRWYRYPDDKTDDKRPYDRLALGMAEGMTRQLIPYWETQHRAYYIDGTKLMKEADKYAEEGKWTEAAKTWGAAFEANENEKGKAKIASNIALANEYLGDIGNAVIWINIASDLIENTSAKSNEYQYINQYKKKLLERERNNPKVIEQIGVEIESE